MSAPRTILLSVVFVSLFAGSVVVIGARVLEPSGRIPPGPPIALEATVGRTVTVEARLRGPALRHPGLGVAKKRAYWVRLAGGRRIVVHSSSPLDCEGLLTLTGTVVRVDARFAQSGTTAFQLDLSHASCL